MHADKVAEFIVPFTKNLASKMQLKCIVLGSMTLPGPSAGVYNMDRIAFRKSHTNVAWMFYAQG